MQSYDRLEYPSFPLPQAHPNRLATMARLFGLDSPPVDACRVLELGCGDGCHLLACAAGLPGSRFVGLDLAAAPIQRAQEAAGVLGLANVEFLCGDLLAFPQSAPFDYIIAHGLYSWVPAAVRDGLLALLRSQLAPSGVAYVSYNTYPGCYVRRMLWEMMRFHAGHLPDPEQQINQSTALLSFLTAGNPRSDPLQQLMARELEHLQSRPGRALLYFDDLEENNTPVYLHEFVNHAQAHGLQFLAETDFFEMQFSIYSEPVRNQLQKLAQHDYVLKEQYLDFLKCRRFRQTLLCRQERDLRRELDPGLARDFHMLSMARPTTTSAVDLAPGVVEEFREPGGAALKLDHALSKAALCCLADAHPRSIPFSGLLLQARRLLAERQVVEQGAAEDEEQALAEVMLAAFSADLVRWQVFEHEWSGALADRPRLTRLARWQLERGDPGLTMPNLVRLQFDSDLQREVLRLANGTHSVEQICSQAAEAARGAGLELPDGDTPREILQKAAHYGLFA